MIFTPRLLAILVAIAALSAAGGYWVASQRSSTSSRPEAATPDRKVLYWYDPMTPNQHFDKPGKSPFMDMELIPRYADEANGDGGSIRIDPAMTQNLGVRLTTVEKASLAQPIRAFGSITFNQRDVAVVQARTRGIVARVYRRAPGDVLQRHAPLADLLAPEWSSAQSEFVALRKHGSVELVSAARERMRLLGIPPELIARLEAGGQVQTIFTIRTPIAGALESLDVREGMTVSEGETLARINGLDTVWLEAAFPETQGDAATLEKAADVRLTAFPGQIFKGQVVAVLPEANTETRTLRVRVELDNPDLKLRPGLFGEVRFAADSSSPALYVASEAVIRTGKRDVVILTDGKGHFTPKDIEIGTEADGKTRILSGLKAGDQVVASGQFLIDSEANLRSALNRMNGAPP